MSEKYIEEFKTDFDSFKKSFVEKMDREVKAYFEENKNPPGDGVDAALGRVLLSELFILHKRVQILEGLSHRHKEFEQ